METSTLEKIWYRLKRIPKRITRICSYIPILWEDEDWDYYYLLVLMRHKVLRMAKEIEENDIIATSEKRVREMRIFADLLERLTTDRWEHYSVKGPILGIEEKADLKTLMEIKRIVKKEQDDFEYAVKMFSKCRRWWD